MRWRVPVAVALAVLALGACGGDSADSEQAEEAAQDAARAFLDRYVDHEGRVVRLDQGGDTVSEGQSYALVLAEVADDDETYRRVWRWTEENLQRQDGLLAFATDASGTVRDEAAASDADVVVAWSLVRSGDDDLVADGERLAEAILDRTTTEGPGGDLVLTAGDWATGDPATLNPSYWVLPAFDELAERTDDQRWDELASSARSLAAELTDGGERLPPDWARLDGEDPTAVPAPDGSVPVVRYSLDAQRLPVWLALSDDESDRDLAAALGGLVEGGDEESALALDPSGAIVEGSDHPLPLVAAAAMAHAAGEVDERDRLLDAAEAQDDDVPTYYGAAWFALGRTLLQTDLVVDAPVVDGSAAPAPAAPSSTSPSTTAAPTPTTGADEVSSGPLDGMQAGAEALRSDLTALRGAVRSLDPAVERVRAEAAVRPSDDEQRGRVAAVLGEVEEARGEVDVARGQVEEDQAAVVNAAAEAGRAGQGDPGERDAVVAEAERLVVEADDLVAEADDLVDQARAAAA